MTLIWASRIASSSRSGGGRRRRGSICLTRSGSCRQVLILELLNQTTSSIVTLVLHESSAIHLVGILRSLQVLLIAVLLLRLLGELRVLLGVGMVHEVTRLGLVGIRGHKIAGKVLLLTAIYGLGKGRRGGGVEASISSVGIIVELKVQAQAVVVVHCVERGVCFELRSGYLRTTTSLSSRTELGWWRSARPLLRESQFLAETVRV